MAAVFHNVETLNAAIHRLPVFARPEIWRRGAGNDVIPVKTGISIAVGVRRRKCAKDF